jgi:hypothetical protein
LEELIKQASLQGTPPPKKINVSLLEKLLLATNLTTEIFLSETELETKISRIKIKKYLISKSVVK